VVARPRLALAAAALVLAAVLGAGLALAGAAIFVGFGGKTTTRVSEIVEPREVTAFQKNAPLSIHDIYKRDAPGVVQVSSTRVVTTQQTDPLFGLPLAPQTQVEEALGSGFVIDKAGHIVTNAHVVPQGLREVDVSFSNNEKMRAKIVGRDPSTDIAVLKVDARSRALTPLPLGNSDQVEVGDSVVAIGNPLGLDRSVTSGIVSALQRSITAPNQLPIDHVIQTDAAINKGNSGGPLINAQGSVIGVNSQIATTGSSDGNIGIGFAIPINTVKTVVAQLIKQGRVEHAFIGIQAQPVTPSIARLFHLPATHGLLIVSVEAGSGAAKAGLRPGTQQATVAGQSYPLGGDLIVSIDGVPVSSVDQLRNEIEDKKPGDTVTLGIYRNDKKKTVTVKLGRQPQS
jgi:S1-C subfamily serine protease